MVATWALESLTSLEFEKDSFLNVLLRGPEDLGNFLLKDEKLQDQIQEKKEVDEEEDEYELYIR